MDDDLPDLLRGPRSSTSAPLRSCANSSCPPKRNTRPTAARQAPTTTRSRNHHCTRALGPGERALALLVDRAANRVGFEQKLNERGVVRHQIAESRIEIQQARLICLLASHVIDTSRNKPARQLVSMAKVAVPRTATRVIDRAIQVNGGGGVNDLTPFPAMYGWDRAMRLFDGPDEVHLRTVALAELKQPPDLPPLVAPAGWAA